MTDPSWRLVPPPEDWFEDFNNFSYTLDGKGNVEKFDVFGMLSAWIGIPRDKLPKSLVELGDEKYRLWLSHTRVVKVRDELGDVINNRLVPPRELEGDLLDWYDYERAQS